MDKLTAILHLPGRQPVEVEMIIDEVLAVDGPGGIRFTIEPKGFTFGVNRTDAEPTLEVDETAPNSAVVPRIRAAGLTQDDVPEGPAEGWPWVVEHCPQIFDGIALSREPYAGYLKARPRPIDQLSQDVAKLLPKVKELRKKNGEWNQLAIAGALGLPGTGGSYYRRIKAIITELEERAA